MNNQLLYLKSKDLRNTSKFDYLGNLMFLISSRLILWLVYHHYGVKPLTIHD